MELENKHKRIHGWLLFALILLAFGVGYNIRGLVYSLIYLSLPVSFLDVYFILSTLTLCLFEVYMIYCFFKFKPNAIFFGKALFFIVVFENLINTFLYPDSSIIDIVIIFIFTLFQAIWIFFLYGSEQVKRLYPKEKRYASGWDFFIVGVTFVFPLIFLIIWLL